MGEVAQIVWPLILKAARASDVDGRIEFHPSNTPVDALLAHIGGRPIPEGRYYARALQELTSAGLVRVEADAIVICSWQEYKPSRERKSDGFSWLLLKVYESSSFRSLPPMCRGFAHLLLRAADAKGYLPGDVPGVLDRLGWQTYHRKTAGPDGETVKVRRHLVEKGHLDRWFQTLIDDGYIVRSRRGALIKKYSEYQPGAEPADPAKVTPRSRQHHADITLGSRRHHAGSKPKSMKSFSTGVHDLSRSDLIRENPPNPPPGGSEPEGGGVLENSKAEEQSHEAPDLPPDRPAWYCSIFADYPNPEGELAAWTEAKRAAALAGSGEQLAAMTLERLPWQKRQTRWRKQGGQFVPSLANYFARGHWRDPKPADPNAFADPPETPAEKKARQDAARAKRIAEQIAASKPTSPSSRTDAIRGSWLARPESAAYSAPANPEALAIASAVLHERLEAFRAENPTAELPALLAGFVAAQEQARGPHGPSARFAEQGPAPPVAAASPAEANRFGKPRGQAAPEPIAADEPIDPAALTKLRRIFARRCDRLDEEIKALEIRTGAIP